MNSVFKDLSFDEIVKPGHIYLLLEISTREEKPEPLEYLYTIRSGQEVVADLERIFGIALAGNYEARAFEGIKKHSADCYELKILCYDKSEGKEEEYSLYLHRLATFEEHLVRTRELFRCE